MSNTPQATTVLLTSVYPDWWSGATTVEIMAVGGANATFDVGDVELFPHGVAFPDNVGAEWAAGIVPWNQIVNVHKAS